MTARNARFWDYLNDGRVKITLRPGQSLTWSKWYRTDEGWSSEGCTWSHEGDGVRCQYGTDGVDCDGRLRQGGESYVPLDGLHAGRMADDITYPAWKQVESWQRDYQAEAAGY